VYGSWYIENANFLDILIYLGTSKPSMHLPNVPPIVVTIELLLK